MCMCPPMRFTPFLGKYITIATIISTVFYSLSIKIVVFLIKIELVPFFFRIFVAKLRVYD